MEGWQIKTFPNDENEDDLLSVSVEITKISLLSHQNWLFSLRIDHWVTSSSHSDRVWCSWSTLSKRAAPSEVLTSFLEKIPGENYHIHEQINRCLRRAETIHTPIWLSPDKNIVFTSKNTQTLTLIIYRQKSKKDIIHGDKVTVFCFDIDTI